MSGVAKFLAASLGGGLLLGAAGGHLANPVMQQHGGDESWRQTLGPDIGAADSGMMAEAPPQDLGPYGGRYSYAPAFVDEPVEAWSDPYIETEWPYIDAEWPEYGEDWPEPPTISGPDVRWQSDMPEADAYGRTVELPPASAIGSTGADAEQVAEEATEEARAAADKAETEKLPPKPRVARGELPAIW
jgi:hypothetical protein